MVINAIGSDYKIDPLVSLLFLGLSEEQEAVSGFMELLLDLIYAASR